MLSFSGSDQGESSSWISCPQLPGPLLLLATPAYNGGMIGGGVAVPMGPLKS